MSLFATVPRTSVVPGPARCAVFPLFPSSGTSLAPGASRLPLSRPALAVVRPGGAHPRRLQARHGVPRAEGHVHHKGQSPEGRHRDAATAPANASAHDPQAARGARAAPGAAALELTPRRAPPLSPRFSAPRSTTRCSTPSSSSLTASSRPSPWRPARRPPRSTSCARRGVTPPYFPGSRVPWSWPRRLEARERSAARLRFQPRVQPLSSQGYKAPAKIDKRLLDPAHMFAETQDDAPRVIDVLNPKEMQKRNRGGCVRPPGPGRPACRVASRLREARARLCRDAAEPGVCVAP